MTARTKSTLLLFATLLVGVLIGAFAASALYNQRLDRIRSFGSKGSFSNMIEEIIVPTDEAQRAQIRAVLERSEARFLAARRQLVADRDSLFAELAPLLTADQQQRLDEWLSRDRRWKKGRRGRDRRGPPPHDRPSH